MIHVTKTYLPEKDKLLSYIDRIYRTGWVTNSGELVQELQGRLEEYLGVRHVLPVANGTLALQIAFKLLGLKGEVVTTPFSFIATASSLVWEGLRPVFADIDPETLNLDVAQIEKAITARTSAILPVHVFGNPCDVEAIEDLAARHGLQVIYDAAHAFGINYQGESLLRWGDVATLSFHATKVFHTVEGGALVIQDDELYEQAYKMVNFGITGPESIETLGINGKMNEFEAAMGLCVLDEMNGIIERRAELAAIYDSILKETVIKQVWLESANCTHGYYPILFEDEAVVKRVQAALEAHNIYPRRYFYPSLDTLDFIAQGQIAPVSRDIASRILCLPLYAGLTDEECRMIANHVARLFDK